MEWLSQNWIWLAFLAVVIWMFSRRGGHGAMGCCGSHRAAHDGTPGKGDAQNATAPPPSLKNEEAKQAAKPAQSSRHHGLGEGC